MGWAAILLILATGCLDETPASEGPERATLPATEPDASDTGGLSVPTGPEVQVLDCETLAEPTLCLTEFFQFALDHCTPDESVGRLGPSGTECTYDDGPRTMVEFAPPDDESIAVTIYKHGLECISWRRSGNYFAERYSEQSLTLGKATVLSVLDDGVRTITCPDGTVYEGDIKALLQCPVAPAATYSWGSYLGKSFVEFFVTAPPQTDPQQVLTCMSP